MFVVWNSLCATLRSHFLLKMTKGISIWYVVFEEVMSEVYKIRLNTSCYFCDVCYFTALKGPWLRCLSPWGTWSGRVWKKQTWLLIWFAGWCDVVSTETCQECNVKCSHSLKCWDEQPLLLDTHTHTGKSLKKEILAMKSNVRAPAGAVGR